MRHTGRTLFNFFAFSLLAFAIYINFLYKEEDAGLLKSPQAKEESTTKSSKNQYSTPLPAFKK